VDFGVARLSLERRAMPQRRSLVADLVVLTVAAYLQASAIVRCTAALVAAPPALDPPEPQSHPPPSERTFGGAELILSRNVFDSSFGAARREPGLCAGLALVAVTESPDRSWSLASIRGEDFGAKLVRAGSAPGDLRVVGIGTDVESASPAVWLEGCRLLMRAPASAAVPPAAPESPVFIERPIVERVLTDPHSLIEGAVIRPERTARGMAYRVHSLRDGCFLERLGARPGDLVQRVNGFRLDSPEQALELWSKLGRAGSLHFELERAGSPIVVDVEIR
jgi:hypothetical protein